MKDENASRSIFIPCPAFEASTLHLSPDGVFSLENCMNIAYGRCHCGCGKKTNIIARDDKSGQYVKGEPFRFCRGHRSKRPLTGRYTINKNGCWIWGKLRDKKRYGEIKTGKIRMGAHVFMYEKYRGKIPTGLQLDHLCRTPACVNPQHLDPVTNAENSRRGKSAILNIDVVRLIKARIKNRKRGDIRQLAREVGVHENTIHSIKSGQSWRDV